MFKNVTLFAILVIIFQPVSTIYGFCDTACGRRNLPCKVSPCKPTRKCGKNVKIYFMQSSDRQDILTYHNKLRNEIAGGRHFVSNFTKSSAHYRLAYREELEFLAHCFTTRCTNVPEECRATPNFQLNVAQNLYIGPVDTFSNVFKRGTEEWEEGLKLLTLEKINYYNETDGTLEAAQLIRDTLKYVGCGMITSNSLRKSFLACNYDNGHIPDTAIFHLKYPGPCNHDKTFPDLCYSSRPKDDFEAPFTIGRSSFTTLISVPNLVLVLVCYYLF